jgi:S-adenosylmethionine-diacylglycerol 3-amino-3-carboxypropyl transferase
MDQKGSVNTEPDAWALEAARLPLAFAQVREDPRLDLEIASRLPAGASVMMIASGGETAVCLARMPLERLVLVDVNPAQLALTRCRMHLSEFSKPRQSMELLGHASMNESGRAAAWSEMLDAMGLAPDCLGPLEMIGELGPDHCGRYEVAFSELRRLTGSHAKEIRAFLTSTDPEAASRMIAPDTVLGECLDAAFSSAFGLENLVALFGQEATQNPRMPFDRHFVGQLRAITRRLAPCGNPWLWQLLSGGFPDDAPYDWLLHSAPILTKPEYVQSEMKDALDNCDTASMAMIHLSNILDWLSPENATATLAAANRVLKPGGRLIIRQLNSCLDIPSLLPEMNWDLPEGRRLQLMDRSFFYPNIHVASRR